MIRRLAATAFASVTALAVAACGDACGASSASPSASARASAAPPAVTSVTATATASVAGVDPGPPPLAAGDAAPDVTFTLADGKTVPLASEKGKFVLVYFYPQDETKGCTIEAEGLRDASKDYQAAGIDVFGVSMQDAASHKKFAEKHELKFPLVVDEDGAVATAFHVPHDKKHAKRQSFLIGKDGKIKGRWLDADPEKNASIVLDAAKG